MIHTSRSRVANKRCVKWNATNNNLPGFSDDNAIAPDKFAYLPDVLSVENGSIDDELFGNLINDIGGA